MKALPLGWDSECVVHWMRHGFSYVVIKCLIGLTQTSSHQYYKHRVGILGVFKMYKQMVVSKPYIESDKRYPDEFPQVHCADEPHYDSKHLRCRIAEGERGVLTMQLLFKHFYVYLCSLFRMCPHALPRAPRVDHQRGQLGPEHGLFGF